MVISLSIPPPPVPEPLDMRRTPTLGPRGRIRPKVVLVMRQLCSLSRPQSFRKGCSPGGGGRTPGCAAVRRTDKGTVLSTFHSIWRAAVTQTSASAGGLTFRHPSGDGAVCQDIKLSKNTVH